MYRKLITIIAVLAMLAAYQPVSASRLAQSTGVVGNGTAASCTETALRNAIASYQTVRFNCGSNPVTIAITKGEISMDGPHTIDGGGKITLDAQGRSRIFRVGYGNNAAFLNMTITNGKAAPSAADTPRTGYGQGGGIFADTLSSIVVQNVTFTNNVSLANADCNGGGAIALTRYNKALIVGSRFINNRAFQGGAIKNFASDLVVDSSTFEGNEANYNHEITQTGLKCVGGGGAILFDGAKPPEQGGTFSVNISNSTFRNNKTGYSGGAIFAYLYRSANFTIEGSTFDGNYARAFPSGQTLPSIEGKGGGIWMGGKEGENQFTGKYYIRNTTIKNNHAEQRGGGLMVVSASLIMNNSTIANNRSTNSYGMPLGYYRGSGGGMALTEGTVVDITTQLTNITVTGNVAGFTGGGIYGSHGGNTELPLEAKLGNSIIANNTANNGEWQNCHERLVSLGGNVLYPAASDGSWGTTCVSSGASTSNPRLGTLGNHGGDTDTVPILSSSSAINRGVATYCTLVDQRGYARAGVCDSGAYEYGGVGLDPVVFFPYVKR